VDPDSKPLPSRLRRFGAAGLRVSVSDGRGRSVADGGLARWLVRVAPAAACGDLAIALVSDARMRALNRSFRRKDYATDVLSFPPADPGSRTPDRGPRAADSGHIGDIVIATGVARRQARQGGHSLQNELRLLALHGLLHLLGYDHDDPGDRGRMARTEARLRRKGGLGAGLIERRLSVDPDVRPPSEAKAARPKAARARSAGMRARVGAREHLG
jgi:probable rRNA maturation factor